MIGVNGRSNFGHTMLFKILEVMQNQLEGLSFNFRFIVVVVFFFFFSLLY